MKIDNKQRLFEVMKRLDESFEPTSGKYNGVIYLGDLLNQIFNPQEFELIEKSFNEDNNEYSEKSDDPESNNYELYSPRTFYSLENTLKQILTNKGINLNDKTIEFLIQQIERYY